MEKEKKEGTIPDGVVPLWEAQGKFHLWTSPDFSPVQVKNSKSTRNGLTFGEQSVRMGPY